MNKLQNLTWKKFKLKINSFKKMAHIIKGSIFDTNRKTKN